MTNILDDDYESDLTEEEHNELVLMSEHAVGPPLSPGTTAVLQAYLSTHLSINNLAAALRTAADHLPDPQMSAHFLHAIADELESL
jgi:hypothetical protein